MGMINTMVHLWEGCAVIHLHINIGRLDYIDPRTGLCQIRRCLLNWKFV